MILVFDTSVEGFSVGVFQSDGVLVDELTNPEPYTHTELLVPSIAALLKQADVKFESLTQIVTTCGPGSFTGIRVGLATAAGLRAALNIPVVTVNTLAALVLSAPQTVREGSKRLHAVLDTKCGEFYHQSFECSGEELRTISEPASVPLPELLELCKDDVIISHPLYAGAFLDRVVHLTPVLLEGVLTASAVFSRHDLQPIYVRSANITQPNKHA